MREFMVLIGEIFFIVLLQSVLELFFEIDKDKRPQQKTMLNIACVLGSLYLLMKFVYDNILSELTAFVDFPF